MHVPMPQWTQLWSANSEPRIVDSAYVPVPYGSLIAVQCKKIPLEVPRVGPESPPSSEESQQYRLDTQDQNPESRVA